MLVQKSNFLRCTKELDDECSCLFLKGRAIRMAFVIVSLATITHSSYSQDITSTWNGFNRIDCMVASRKCILVIPVTRAAGSPWIWRTEFFGHEPQADMALVAKGFHIAFIDMQNMYGGPEAMALMDRMYEHAITDRGLSKKSYSKGLVGADCSLSIGEFFTLIVSHASTTMLRSAILRVGREEKEKVLDPLSTGSDALKPIDCRKRRHSRFAETPSTISQRWLLRKCRSSMCAAMPTRLFRSRRTPRSWQPVIANWVARLRSSRSLA